MRFPRIPIPRRLNKAWDFVASDPSAVFLWVLAVGATFWVALWLHLAWWLLSSVLLLLTGVGYGYGAAVWRIGALKAERDQLKAENKGLHLVVAPPVDTSAEQLTAKLPRIPEGDDR